MNCLEDVSFRMSSSFVEDSEREANLVRAPDFDMPDCEEILECTMHDFSLEKKFLDWVESAPREDTPWHDVTPDVIPTAPPYWHFFVGSEEDSQEETKEDGTEEAFAVPRSLSPAGNDEAQLIVSVNGGDQCSKEGGDPKGEGSSSAASAKNDRKVPPVSEPKGPGAFARFFGLPQPKPRTSPVPPAIPSEDNCPKVKQRQSLLLLKNVKNELERAKGKLAAFLRPLSHSWTDNSLASRAFRLSQRGRNNRNLRFRSASDASPMGTLKPVPPSTPCMYLRPPISASSIPPIQKHKPTVACLSPYPCLSPLPGAPLSPGSHGTHPDSTADLLSALSQEERDLIEPVLALGYPTRRAILALQRTGKQSLGQFLSYLSACDKLLKLGYEEAQVEEAMEMFQNPEKAAEFLHLLARFNDMGFQQAEIKEALLLCENQGDNALEELMTRAQ